MIGKYFIAFAISYSCASSPAIGQENKDNTSWSSSASSSSIAGEKAVLSSQVPVPLASERIAAGFSNPVYVTHAPDDDTRLFVVEQAGLVRIVNLKTGAVNVEPFLDISFLVSGGGEQGLLSIAFHPDYKSNGFFYVNYTNPSGDTVIGRYERRAGTFDNANPLSEVTLLLIDQPFANHNGGQLQFGLDGFLYIGMGDGGSAGDPNCYAQRFDDPIHHFLGKMLRIDVNQNINTPPYYGIPAGNPFGGAGQPPAEVWALGLRNPWRFSIDRLTGDLYIGDVGQAEREEINFQSGLSAGGENYGWKIHEGDLCFDPHPLDTDCIVGTPSCDDPSYTSPVRILAHPDGCSIIGGYVYRGCAIPSLQGHYFFSDWCSRKIWSFDNPNSSLLDYVDRTADLTPPAGSSFNNIQSFGEDLRGEIYIVDRDGDIFKILPETPIIKEQDIDCSGSVNTADLLSLLVKWGACDGCREDFNGDHAISVADLLDLLINWG